MFKVDLGDYKESRIYFQFFDVVLKDIPIKKEDYLKQCGITPSSYRLSRKIEQNIGKAIIKKLASIHKYVMPTHEEINNIEKKLNQIYLDMYYKIYDNYDEYQKYIDELLEKNLIIFPIIKLFRLFLNGNKKIDFEKQKSIDETLFKEVFKYKTFFNKSVLEIYNIFDVAYENNDINHHIMKSYDNGLIYFILASKSLGEKKYAECIYFINICKDILIKENNYKRLMYLYNKLMQCYLYYQNYEECYDLSRQVMMMWKSFGIEGYEYDTPQKNYLASCIALSKYDEVISVIENKKSINYTELCIFLVCLYEKDKSKYEEAFVSYSKNSKENNNYKGELVLTVINDYNVKGIKKDLDRLNDFIMLTLIKILKERK